ncbi:MAG: quinolinate synthase NadA [Chloroflexota bacterium]|nr:quinolinate synthase NadA [Chloroflexota bacterium]
MNPTEIIEKINKLKGSLNAVIVAHNYQRPEVQDIADFTGDSLELSRKCTEVDADVIVFAGVHFMAESACILNPDRKVLLAEENAGCPMADMITPDDLLEWKRRYPDAAVVCYINTSAAIKALSDICCTSANGVQVVRSLPQDEIIFVPDENLGRFVSRSTDKRMILYPGFCPTHVRVIPRHVDLARERYPGGVVLVHPECTPDVIDKADAALSTSQMIRYARESEAMVFLIGTEGGLLHRLRLDNPGKEFHLLSEGLVCPDMKLTTLESVARTMEEMRNQVTVPEDVRLKAKLTLDRMLQVT